MKNVAFALLYASALSTAAEISVDGSQQFQTMDGFGTNVHARSWNDGELRPALDMLVDELGGSIFRVIIDEMDWEAVNDNADPEVFDWTYYNQIYTGPEFTPLWETMRYLNQKGIVSGLMLSFMGKPADWMQDGAVATLAVDKESEFVEMIASAVYHARVVEGIQFTLLSPVNEPNWDIYEGPLTPPQQFTRVLHGLADKLDAIGLGDIRFVVPETAVYSGAGGFESFFTEIVSDPVVRAKIASWGTHDYSLGSFVSNARDHIDNSAFPEMTLWVTEVARFASVFDQLDRGPTAQLIWDGFDTVYRHAIRAGRGTVPHNDLGNGPALLDYDTVTGEYTPREVFFECAQLFKFVDPGAIRVGASSDSGDLEVEAFHHPVLRRTTIVGRHTGGGSVSVNGLLANVDPVTSFEFYQTNSTMNLERGTDVPGNAGAFSFSVDPETVFTLVSTVDAGTAPTVATPAVATPNPVTTGTSADLSVLGADDGGEENLIYEWSVVSKPAGAPEPVITVNRANVAKNTVVQFPQAGSYAFEAAMYDIGGQSATSTVMVTVDRVAASIVVEPGSPSIPAYATQQFHAAESDQFGLPMPEQPQFEWSATGGGTIDSAGIFTAGSVAGGPFSVVATDGASTGDATVMVVGISGGTLGNTGSSESSDNLWSGGAYLHASRHSASSWMVVTSIFAKVVAISGRYQCAVYGDANGLPGALLATSAEVLDPPVDDWYEFPLGVEQLLTGGEDYWLAIWSDSPDARVFYTDNGTLRWQRRDYGPWPAFLATTSGASVDYSIYASGPALTPYQQWKAAFGLPFAISDGDDTDGDRIDLLMEYGLNLDPTRQSRDGLPQISRDLEYSFYRARPELTYEVLSSPDLDAWSVFSTNPGASGERVAISFGPAAGDTEEFFSLRILRP